MDSQRMEAAQHNMSLNSGITILNKQIIRLEEEIVDSQAQIESEADEIRDYEDKMVGLSSELGARELQIRDLSEKCVVSESLARDTEEADEYRAEIERLESSNTALETRCLQLEKEILTIKEADSAAEAVLSTNEEMDVSEEIKRLKSKNTALKHLIDNEKAEIAQLRQSITSEAVEFGAQLRAIENYGEAMKTEIEHDGLPTKLHLAPLIKDENVESHEDGESEMAERCKEAELEISELQQELEDERSEEMELKEQLSDKINGQNPDFSEHLAQAIEETAEMASEVDLLRQQKSEETERVAELENQLNQKRMEIIALNRQIQVFVSENKAGDEQAVPNTDQNPSKEKVTSFRDEAAIQQEEFEKNRQITDYNILESRVSQLEMKLEKKIQECVDESVELAEAKTMLSAKEALIQQLRTELESSSEKDQANALVIEMSRRIEELTTQVQNSEKHFNDCITKKESEIEFLQAELDDKNDENQKLKHDISHDLERVKRHVASKDDKIRRLSSHLLTIGASDNGRKLTSSEAEWVNKVHASVSYEE